MERASPYQAKKFVRQDKYKEPFSNKGKGPAKFQGKTYVPATDASTREWVRPSRKLGIDRGKWKVVSVDYGSSYRDNSQVSKKHSYVLQNYMGKILWSGLSGGSTRGTRKLHEKLEAPTGVIAFNLWRRAEIIDSQSRRGCSLLYHLYKMIK